MEASAGLSGGAFARVGLRERLMDTRTVDNHMRRLREKLGKAGNPVETVRGFGYRMANIPLSAAKLPFSLARKHRRAHCLPANLHAEFRRDCCSRPANPYESS